MKVERILAATDFSRSAESAVQRAAWLARNCGATLEIAHSIDLPILPEAWRKLVEGEGFTEEELRAQAQVRLDQLATALALDSGITPGTLIFSEKPSQALAEFARGRTLVMATHSVAAMRMAGRVLWLPQGKIEEARA